MSRARRTARRRFRHSQSRPETVSPINRGARSMILPYVMKHVFLRPAKQ